MGVLKVPRVALPQVRLPGVRIPRVRLSPKKTLQKQYYAVHTVLFFLFNQVLPSRRAKAALPEQYASLDCVQCSDPARKAPAVLPAQFTLTTWNVEMGYQHEQLQRDLHTLKTDIVLLQEVPVLTPQSAPLLAEYGAYYVYAPGLFVAKRNAKYSFAHRGQLTLANVVPLKVDVIPLPAACALNPDTSKDRFGRRIAVYTKLQTPKGTLGIYNVHLENYSAPTGRRMQMQEIFEYVKRQQDTYVIVAGDWNNIYGQIELLGITKATGLMRAKTGRTCKMFALDHIFHSKNLHISAKVVRKKSSDHNPIIADVKLL